jgi:hypothetical protein
MNGALEAVRTALQALGPVMTNFGLRVQETALEIIAGPGGVLVLVLGILGVCVLAYDLVWLARRMAAGRLGRRAPAPSRAVRARGLLELGAGPAEIARAVGLPRDALALVTPVPGAPRPKVPAAAQTAAPQPTRAPARNADPVAQVATKKEVTGSEVAVPARARPLPNSRARNANAPHFGEAA